MKNIFFSIYTIFCLFILMFTACQRQSINSINEYRAWFNDERNGFIKQKHIENLNIKVQFRPPELMMLNELPATTMVASLVDSLKRSYGNSLYFVMEIGYDDQVQNETNINIENYNIKSYEEYAQRINDLAFNISNYVWIEGSEGEKTVPQLAHLERGYELGKKESILFAFPGSDNNSKVSFVFSDEVFGTGINRFVFDTKKNIPALPVKTK